MPLLSATERDVDYLTLDEALAGGWAQITEVSDAGQVSELKIVVKGTGRSCWSTAKNWSAPSRTAS